MLYASLQEHFPTLDLEELELVKENRKNNRLLFAVTFKFFQLNGRYPTKKDKIEHDFIFSLAEQLEVNVLLFEASELESQIVKRFRKKIRKFLCYKIATLSDADNLIVRLSENAKDGPYTMPQYREKTYEYCKEKKLEPFSSKRTDRYIRAAIHQFEKQFFQNIKNQLSSKTINQINKFLNNEPDVDNDVEIKDVITLRELKLDIPGDKLKYVELELKK